MLKDLPHSNSESDRSNLEMLKRLKRLEKFDQQLQAKHKGAKPKLMQGGSGLGGVYSGQGGNGAHFPSQEESQMDLDEFAKHIGIKVSENLISPGGIFFG